MPMMTNAIVTFFFTTITSTHKLELSSIFLLIQNAINNNTNYPHNSTCNIKYRDKWTDSFYSIIEINQNTDY